MRSERQPRAPRPPRTQVMATVGGAHSKETAAYMKRKQAASRFRARDVPEQLESFEILCEFGPKPSRHTIHGWRVFDFWWHSEAVALELDGPSRDAEYAEIMDRYNFARSGILVYRAAVGDAGSVEAVAKVVGTLGPLADRKPDTALYKDAAKAWDEWEKIRCILDPRRTGTEQPPIRTQR